MVKMWCKKEGIIKAAIGIIDGTIFMITNKSLNIMAPRKSIHLRLYKICSVARLNY